MSDHSSGGRPPPSPGHFPYAFTPVTGLPWYARYRAEGRSPVSCALHGIHYLLKYRRKLESAPREEIAYFDHQRQLLRMLAAEPEQEGDIPLAMVGDIMWIADGWSSFLATEVLDHLNRHAAVLGNLETVISSSFRVSRPFPEFFLFNSHPALLTSFQRPDGRNTFTALSTTNNHTLDFRDRGALDTMRFLDEQGILHSGIREHPDDPPYVVLAVNGVRVGFYAASWGLNDRRRLRRSKLTVNIAEGLAPEGARDVDLSGVGSVLAAMDAEGVELKVIYLHWGFEYELYPTPRQMQVAREIVRAGADVIVGSHPHVQQPAEVCFVNGYETRFGDRADDCPALRHPTGCILEDDTGRPRKAIVFYSLGNFATAMSTFLCRVGLIQSLRLRRDTETGRVDWFAPRARFVHNVRKDPVSGRRRLVFLPAHSSSTSAS